MGEIAFEFRVGSRYVEEKIISMDEILRFADLSGDNNPLHVDGDIAKKSRFGGIIAHGMLMGAYISAIVGTKFPGNGTIYISQSLNFLSPVYVGDRLLFEIILNELLGRHKAVLTTIVKKMDGTIVLEGEAIVKLPEKIIKG